MRSIMMSTMLVAVFAVSSSVFAEGTAVPGTMAAAAPKAKLNHRAVRAECKKEVKTLKGAEKKTAMKKCMDSKRG